MGNKQNKDKDAGFLEYQRLGPVLVKETEDPQTGDKYSTMEFSRQMQSEKEYDTWVKQISRIQDSETQETLLLPEKLSFVKAGLCGSTGNAQLIYENFPFVLNKEIQNRKKLGRFFNEPEMWYLLYNIVRAGNKFQKIGKKIGDVNPENILINDDGQIKAIATCSIPNEIDNYQKAVEDKSARVYLAPEQLNEELLSKGEYPTSLNPNRAQVFSIGLTILSSGTLEECFAIYEGKRINEHRLNQFIGSFREKYSNYIFNVLVSMLAIRPEQRRSCSDIYNELLPYEENILELEPFPERINTVNPQVRQVSYQPQSQYHQQQHSQQGSSGYQNRYTQPANYQNSGYRPNSQYAMR